MSYYWARLLQEPVGLALGILALIYTIRAYIYNRRHR